MIKLRRAPGGADSLQWRIDASFDNYVRNQTGDGTITVSAGASRDDDGYYHFPRIDTSSGSGNLQFGGSVEFRAYLGVLSLRIADPSLHVSRDMVRMYIVDDAAPAGTRLELATATLEPGRVGPVMLDLRLTERGSELFFGKYPAGAPLAPATVLLPAPAIGMALTEGAH
ncbi:HtaA domain-containing protein [Arthrobacter sp. PsM3]|uniref:HtaA domain-containing protein n=1 Tax=Arthrobacter sp. PsM3 TaxID=3030531 RepID=UPI00263BBFCA|nr:HtaA domain-containing protein [Arthrobacter sp. PsM3]MDN4644215.1 HtaA domain-containing protein [Arthrobacter sp. PsM3]